MPSWAGYGLSAGVDSYLRTRQELSREDEMNQIAQLRHQQGQAMAQQLQEKEDLAEGARRDADPNASVSDVTLAAGVPATAPASSTVQTSDADQGVGQNQGGPAGNMAPDATLGNQPNTMTATPGSPGTPAVTKRYRTQADAMKNYGPELYGRLAGSAAGRAQMKEQGYTTDIEIAKQQKTATAMQEMKGLLAKSEQAAKAGRSGDSTYLQAAAMERMAEIQDTPQMQAHYMEKASALRTQANADAADPRANEDFRNIWSAYEDLKEHPTAENKVKFQEAATSSKTKLGQQFGQKSLDAYATHHSDDQFNTELMDAMRTNGGNAPRAIAQMMKNPSPAFMQALPQLLESKNPAIQKVFGLEDDDKLVGNGIEARMALMETKSQGLDITTRAGMHALVKNYQAIVRQTTEAKQKDPGNNQFIIKTVYEPQLKLAQQNVERAQEGFTKAQGQGTKARTAAEKHLNEARDQANDIVDTINGLLPKEHQMPHSGSTSSIDVAKPVVPVGDPKKVADRYAELVKQGRTALGRMPTAQELARIKADAKSQLTKEGLTGPPGGGR
jgi:hypothetical protein